MFHAVLIGSSGILYLLQRVRNRAFQAGRDFLL